MATATKTAMATEIVVLSRAETANHTAEEAKDSNTTIIAEDFHAIAMTVNLSRATVKARNAAEDAEIFAENATEDSEKAETEKKDSTTENSPRIQQQT